MEDKIKFFALYYDSAKVLCTRYTPREFSVHDMLPEMLEQITDFDSKHLDKYTLLLRPLESITDEEAIEVAKLTGIGGYEIIDQVTDYVKSLIS